VLAPCASSNIFALNAIVLSVQGLYIAHRVLLGTMLLIQVYAKNLQIRQFSHARLVIFSLLSAHIFVRRKLHFLKFGLNHVDCSIQSSLERQKI
jgi:hypothetical protein